jgi:uncharacterized membrane protein (DUF106 family)
LELLAFFRVVVMDTSELSEALEFISDLRKFEIEAERQRDQQEIEEMQAEEEQRLLEALRLRQRTRPFSPVVPNSTRELDVKR